MDMPAPAVQQSPQSSNKHDVAAAKILHSLQAKHMDVPTMQKLYSLGLGVLKNPQSYPQARQEALASGKLTEQDLPPQYDEKIVSSLVLALQIGLQASKEHSGGANAQGGGAPQPLQMPKSL